MARKLGRPYELRRLDGVSDDGRTAGVIRTTSALATACSLAWVRTGGELALPFSPLLLYYGNMAKSISVVQKKRGPGRPKKEGCQDPVTAIRLSSEISEALDKAAAAEEGGPSRSELIRTI